MLVKELKEMLDTLSDNDEVMAQVIQDEVHIVSAFELMHHTNTTDIEKALDVLADEEFDVGYHYITK